jgi:predicted phosphoribosyltransferase
MARRERLYRGNIPRIPLTGRDVLLVDDGLATGATMRAAVRAIRHEAPARIVVAVPVGAPDSCQILSREADELICPERPEPFNAVGVWYEEFGPTSDAEVIGCLRDARSRAAGAPRAPAP